MKKHSLLNFLKESQQALKNRREQDSKPSHRIQPSIEELEKYAHTPLGASYLKARLFFDEGKKEFFSGHQKKGLELIRKGFWEDEKACPFSEDEGDAVLKYCWDQVTQKSSPDVELQNTCGLVIALMHPAMEPKIMTSPYLLQEGSFRAVTLVASWLASAGEWENALPLFMQGYQIDPTDVENYYAIGVMFKFLNDWTSARAWLERYIQHSDIQGFKRPAAHYELAAIALAENDITEAAEQAKLARITLKERIPYLPPLSTSSQMMVESMLGLMGETNSFPKNARKAAEKIGKQHASNNSTNASSSSSSTTSTRVVTVPPPSKEASVLKEKGNQLFEKKKYKEAIECYLKALSLGKSSIDAILHSNISVSYAKMDNYVESLTHAESSIIVDPYLSKGYARKAFALMKLNRTQEARKFTIISNALGMKIVKGHELHSLLPDSQIVLVKNSYNLKKSMLEQNTTQRLFIVITDEDSYNFSTDITRPCSLIGIGREKPKFTGMFDTLFWVSSPDCHFDNLSISHSRTQLVYVREKGSLTARDCHFFSSSNPMPLVACGEGGKLTLLDCEIYGAMESGGVMAHDNGSIVKMTNCKIHDCSRAALEVVTHAKAEVDNCEFYECGQGIIGYNRGKSIRVNNTRVYQHAKEGVLIAMGCSATFSKVSIFKNNHFGLSVDNTGTAKLTECDITDNLFYGVSVKGDCPFEMNNSTISGNQCGGVRIGINYTSPIIISGCKIVNNTGPGIHNESDKLKIPQEKKNFINQMKQMGLSDRDTSNKVFKQVASAIGGSLKLTITDCIQEGNDSRAVESSQADKCSFCHVSAEKCFKCAKCKQVMYCGTACQKKDWSKHKIFCDSMAESNTVTIDISSSSVEGKLVRNSDLSSKYKKRQEEKKGKYMDGDDFVVKIQTIELDSSPDQTLTLYDESRELVLNFSNRDIFYLIMKYGTLGENQMTSKKIFVKARFNKENNQLNVYTHKVLPVRLW